MSVSNKIKDHFISQFGSNLISLYQYGPPPLSKQGPYCVLLVLESSNVTEFRDYAKKKQALTQNIQLSCFTKKELFNAVDVFPIEFIEIKETKQLLYGQDLLENIQVQLTHLRHECEYTLRSTLLKLRAALLRPKVNLNDLIFESFPIFFSTLKCIFKLNNKQCPETQDDCLLELAQLTKTPLDEFTKILTKNKITESDFQHYINTLSQLTFYVNEL
tara:strand:- start:743 stop:1393 length:651 start_codon:yes stop_codon:yes gene_type:complete